MIGKRSAIALLALSLAGCGNRTDEGDAAPEPTPVSLEKLTAASVTVSRSEDFGRTNPAPLGAFSEAGPVETFVEAFRSADRIDGMLDVRRPDYDVVIASADGKASSYHLWLDRNAGGGMVTTIADTGTGYRLSEEESGKLRGLIFGLRYSPEQAAENGDVVNGFGGIRNLDRWKRFVGNVENGRADSVHLTSYTVEGAPIFYDLRFDGKAIAYTYDGTMDGYGGSPSKQYAYCKGLGETDELGYLLSGCDNEEARATFHFKP